MSDELSPDPEADGAEGTQEPDEPEAPVELFAEPEPLGIRAKAPIVVVGRSRWSALAMRGPIVLGMLALALFLGAATYLFVNLSELPDNGSIFPGPTVSTDAAQAPPTVAEIEDAFLLLQFSGRGQVWIDGAEIGTWDDSVRLALPPGDHAVEVRGDAAVSRRTTRLRAGEEETLSFQPPEAPAPSEALSNP